MEATKKLTHTAEEVDAAVDKIGTVGTVSWGVMAPSITVDNSSEVELGAIWLSKGTYLVTASGWDLSSATEGYYYLGAAMAKLVGYGFNLSEIVSVPAEGERLSFRFVNYSGKTISNAIVANGRIVAVKMK